MVFLLQVVETVQSFVDMVKFCGVEVDVAQQTAHFLCDILQLDIGAVHACGELLCLREHTTDTFHGIQGTTQLRYDACFICLQGIVGSIEGALDVLSMGHRVALLFQFFLFANIETSSLELLILELQEIHVLTVAFYLFLQGLQFVGSLVIGIVACLVVCQFLGVIGNNVEHTHLEVLFVQQQVLMLRVYIHEAFTQFLEHRQLHGGVVDKRPTFACCCQFSADNTVVGIVFYVVLIEEILHVIARQVEVGFYHASFSSLLQGLQVCSLS